MTETLTAPHAFPTQANSPPSFPKGRLPSQKTYLFVSSVFSPLETGSARTPPTPSPGQGQGCCTLQHKTTDSDASFALTCAPGKKGGQAAGLTYSERTETPQPDDKHRSTNEASPSSVPTPNTIQTPPTAYPPAAPGLKCERPACVGLVLAADTFSLSLTVHRRT